MLAGPAPARHRPTRCQETHPRGRGEIRVVAQIRSALVEGSLAVGETRREPQAHRRQAAQAGRPRYGRVALSLSLFFSRALAARVIAMDTTRARTNRSIVSIVRRSGDVSKQRRPLW